MPSVYTPPHTLLDQERLASLESLAATVLREHVPGDIVECGVYRGGSAALLAHTMRRDPKRTLWLYDNFEGVLPPGPRDPVDGWQYVSHEPNLEERVQSLVSQFLPANRIVIKKGLFSGTFREPLPERIALLHIDADWYESVLQALRILAPRMSPGGVIILDDYGHFAGAREAFEEFCRETGEFPVLEHVGYTQVWWRTPSQQSMFRAIQPHTRLPHAVEEYLRTHPSACGLLERWNTLLPMGGARAKGLHELCSMPKLSTLAIGALINASVSHMPDDACYLNIGTWFGFSLFSAMTCNPTKHCIGVDNFSQFHSPRDAFARDFERHRTAAHAFFEMDFRQYFRRVHRGPIGVYFYDGPHDAAGQRDGLELAEPFFTDDCIIIIDDTNWEEPRHATEEFLAKRPGQYRILLDKPTANTHHPTWWNGIIVLQRIFRA